MVTTAFLHERGKRPYNEDSLYPTGRHVSQPGNVFMVCDGVGRSNRGDVASQEVCARFPKHYLLSQQGDPLARLKEALRSTEADLREVIANDPSLIGTATTLTFADITPADPVVAWIGDSRVYHIRDGRVLFVTADHSVVAELIARGEVSVEEARHHPKRHVITRAVTGESPADISFARLDNVLPCDYIMLCSDGVSGALDDGFIERFFRSDQTVARITEEVDRLCRTHSTDNYTMWLLKVDDDRPKRTSRRPGMAWLVAVVVLIALVVALFTVVPGLRTSGTQILDSLSNAKVDTNTHSIFSTPRDTVMPADPLPH
jgi:protein phosphatase